MKIVDFLIDISEKALANPKLYFQSGHNGPYYDPETPVRNYGHWLIIFSKSFELTGNQIYLNKIKELAEYLICKRARPHGFSFHHRNSANRDKCNGLIGQAWTFESLACAASVIDDMNYADAGKEVFFQHNFNEDFGLWNRLEINGEILSIDDTFNHQLWFAACASLLCTPRREEVRERILRFMDCLPENLSVLDNGLIYHPIEKLLNQTGSDWSIRSRLIKFAKNSLSFLRIIDDKTRNSNQMYREKMINKSIGYHQFNMYAFAMLKETLPDHSFWQSSQLSRSVDYLHSDEFKNGLSDNIYGYSYNPPGFEVPYALSELTDISEDEVVNLSCRWVNEQFKRCYNPKTQTMDRNTEDFPTHTARVYELTRLPTSVLERIEVDI